MTLEDVVGLEEGALNGWPALHTEAHGGWLWRFADGYTKRANAVLALYAPAPDDVDRRIDAVEAAYGRAGLPATFKVPGHPAWANLDAVLGARGYARVDPSVVMTRALGAEGAVEGVRCEEAFDDPWWQGFSGASDLADRHRTTARNLGGRVARPLVASAGPGVPVAWGYAALVDEQAWLFDIVVAPGSRRQGWGRKLVAGLLAGASARGARLGCLQAFAANAAARTLYEGLGFAVGYEYWYRSRGPKVP